MNQHLKLLHAELGLALSGLDVLQTQLRPEENPARWNIQQIAGHLRLTYVATIEAMNARIAKSTGTKARPSALQYVTQFTLIRMGYFPRGREAPARVIPSSAETAMSGAELNDAIENALSSMSERMDRAAEIFGSRRRVISHMVLGPLSLDQWARFHLIHGRHHIRQINSIRRDHGV